MESRDAFLTVWLQSYTVVSAGGCKHLHCTSALETVHSNTHIKTLLLPRATCVQVHGFQGRLTHGHLSFCPSHLPCRLGPLVIVRAQVHTHGVLGRGRHGLLLLLTVLFAFLPSSFFLFHRTGGEDCLCFQDVGNIRTLRRSFISTLFHQTAVNVCKELIFSRDWWGGQVSRELLLKENMRKESLTNPMVNQNSSDSGWAKPHSGTKNTDLVPKGEKVTLTTTCICFHSLHSWALVRVGQRGWTQWRRDMPGQHRARGSSARADSLFGGGGQVSWMCISTRKIRETNVHTTDYHAVMERTKLDLELLTQQGCW